MKDASSIVPRKLIEAAAACARKGWTRAALLNLEEALSIYAKGYAKPDKNTCHDLHAVVAVLAGRGA